MASSYSKISFFLGSHEKDSLVAFSKISNMGNVWKRCVFGYRFDRIRVDGRTDRRKKSPFSNQNGYLWTGPKCKCLSKCMVKC